MTQAHLAGIITPSKALTFYTKFGDVLPFLSLTLSLLFLILAVVKKRNERKKSRSKDEPF
jgi:apolipoprotein N-acyltransferase